MGNKINLKMLTAGNQIFLPGTDNTLSLSSCKGKYRFDLNLRVIRGSKFQNLAFNLVHLLADTSSVKFIFIEFSSQDFDRSASCISSSPALSLPRSHHLERASALDFEDATTPRFGHSDVVFDLFI